MENLWSPWKTKKGITMAFTTEIQPFKETFFRVTQRLASFLRDLFKNNSSAKIAAVDPQPPVAEVPYYEKPYDEKIEGIDPILQEKVPEILSAMEKRGFRPILYAGHRTVAEQKELYDKGHTKVLFSFHNAYKGGKKNSYAADIIDKDFMGEYGGKWASLKSPKRKPFWEALGEEAEKRGLVWGGRWSFFDPGHVQCVPNSFLAQAKRESKQRKEDIG